MKKLGLILILTCLFSTHLAGQKTGYKISVKIENSKDSMLILGNYYANMQQAQDTAFPDKKGLFVFEKKEKTLLPGIYFMVTPSGQYFDFIIDKEPQYFSFETKDGNYIQDMKIKNSEDNRLFYEYSKTNLESFKHVDSVKRNNPHLDSIQLDEEYKKAAAILDSFKIRFIKNYPEHLLTLVFNATKEIDVPDAPLDEHGNPDPLFQYLYYREHYFDNVALDNDGMVRTPEAVFYARFTRYFDNVLKNQPVDTIIKYADRVIDKAEPSKEMFKYIVWYLADKYLKSPIMGYEAVYVHIIKKYYTTGKATWATPSGIEEETMRANRWEKLLIGKPAQELITKDTNDKWVSLYGIQAKYTLLIFWGPSCGHCSVIVPEFHEFYLKNKEKYNLEVYAVNTELSEIEKWKQFIRDHKFQWINTSGAEANINWKDVYDVNTTPTVYLFDKDKIIIGKHLNAKLLEEILINQENMNKP